MQNEERINGLETQVRTLKRIVYGLGCLLVAGVVVSATSLQTVPDVIQAKKFEVVDKSGKAVTTLDANLRLRTLGSTIGIMNGAYLVFNEKGEELLQLQSNSPSAGTAGELVLMRANGTQFISLNYEHGQGIITTTNDYNKLVSTLPSLNQRLLQACGPPPYGGPPAKVKYLIDSGAGVNFEADDQTYGPMTPLTVAIMSLGNGKDTSVISMLLKNGADPNKMSNLPLPKQGMPGRRMQFSPLMWIVSMNSDPAATQLLIKAGADVNAQGANMSLTPLTPLMVAARSPMSSPEIVSILLKAGADANVKTSKGKTALDFAKANPAMKGTKVIGELEAAMKP